MIGGKVAEATNADKIKSCFVFTTAISKQELNVKPFRDPLGLEIFQILVKQLRVDGFHATEAKPGKACDAIFKIRFPRFFIVAIVLVERSVGAVDFSVLTWCTRPFWQRVAPELVSDEWIRACSAIEAKLKQCPSVASLERLSKSEAEAYWKER